MKLPEFKTKKELFTFLHENHDTILEQKKAEIKRADAVSYQPTIEIETETVNKSEQESEPKDEIKVRAIINTTNLMDSHSDVHLPGLWSKSLKEGASRLMHLQEHQIAFDKIISNKKDLKAYTKKYQWKDLGIPFEGETEALVFDSNVKKSRNKFMFEQYAGGLVDNHSVGMQYVKMEMAINDSDFKDEYKAWKKYFPEIANKEAAEQLGYFFAVKEAKVIEGSAVPIGSNWATPTIEFEKSFEPSDDTQIKEPTNVTPEKTLSDLIKETNFFN